MNNLFINCTSLRPIQLAGQFRVSYDMPVGALLPGGIYPSTLVSLTQSVPNRPVETCPVGFRVTP